VSRSLSQRVRFWPVLDDLAERDRELEVSDA
jgi:hypothetical protein